ncbi:unnamed protein product [Phytophthora fragariaefolia]|uniref:Unnamed protein product n=1 Tax=Phytophthora fragariaefolia TaxID=1490495 RepID=A0A9W6X8N4_9STRA|nr:unnamed protein product [Phytophthora fragariaefolia]
MQRAARGLDTPLGTAGQEAAAMECFSEFLALGNMNEDSIASIAKSLSAPVAQPSQNFYSLLTAFSIFLQTKPSARGSGLAKATAVGYMSQVVNLLRERYPQHLSDSKRIETKWAQPLRSEICWPVCRQECGIVERTS